MTRKRKITIAVIIVVAVLLLNVTLCLISAYNFFILNYFRSFTGYLTLQWTDASVVEIRGGENRLMLVDWEKSPPTLVEYMASLGYIHLEDEQMGHMHHFEKDGERQMVLQTPGGRFFSRRPYTTWEWR